MRVICVDDEQPALDTFWSKAKEFSEIESLQMFSDGEEALKYAEKNRIDTVSTANSINHMPKLCEMLNPR